MTNDFSLQIPKLSPRLRMVADRVPSCERVIDIGTDHAFAPIYLIAMERCDSAIASDIHEGPAETARRNIAQYQMEEQISVMVGDGLDTIRTTSQDCIIIAGMGGFEIRSILSKGPFPAKSILLQPQKSFRELREFLAKEGYAIKEEAIAKEQSRYYLAMAVEYTGIPYSLTAAEAEIGPRLLSEKPLHFHEYLDQRLKQMRKQALGDLAVRQALDQLEEFFNNL